MQVERLFVGGEKLSNVAGRVLGAIAFALESGWVLVTFALELGWVLGKAMHVTEYFFAAYLT